MGVQGRVNTQCDGVPPWAGFGHSRRRAALWSWATAWRACFWWADNLVAGGHLDEGRALFDSLCARVNHVWLLPEQIDPDPGTGAFLGSFPRAFSHIGLISTAVNLARHQSEGVT